MGVLVNSTKLAAIAGELSALQTALQERATDFGDVISSTRSGLGLLEQTWRGPDATDIGGQVSTYVDTVATATGAAESAATTVGSWASEAEAASDRMVELERRLSSIEYRMATAEEPSDYYQAYNSIESQIEQERVGWAQTCTSRGSELSSAISTLQQCSLAELGTVDQRSALMGPAYFTAMASWAVAHEMDLPILDPTGQLAIKADERLAEFSAGPHAALLYAVIETMKQANLDEMDGESSREDWLLSTDPDVVRFRLERAAELAGLEFTEDELDALTAEIVEVSAFGAAVSGDSRDAVDDRFDEHADIEAGIDAGGVTEHDYVFGDNPSEVDAYVQAWLEAQWDGSPGIFDIAKTLLLPDFAVMNPWSDEFDPFWAAIEVIGIVPVGKIGKVAKLGRLGSHGDDLADARRLLDEGGDLLSDGRRAGDDVLGSTDEVLGSSDEVLGSSDEVLGSSDEVLGAADELPSPRGLPRDDPRVVADIERVGNEVVDKLQVEVDRIWAEAQEALPGASPQQLGTRAHRELEAWIKAHADELVDPDSGYRVQAEVSFDSAGEVARGTKGSIRPDIILEREAVDEFGDVTWEVVEVADLKTGRAGISTSWQGKVDEWLGPERTREVRPGPVPVPE